jgi:hypothetical protein
MIRTFYVRPQSAAGYGAGDGSSYQDAWNGFQSVDWAALAGQPATLWVCGEPGGGPGGFVTLHVEWSYLKSQPENFVAPESVAPQSQTRINTRRESPVPV